MGSVKERPAFLFPASDVLNNIFNVPEIMKSCSAVKENFSTRVEGSRLIFDQAQKIITRWEDEKDGAVKYFRTKPVRISVGNEQVDLIIVSGEEKTDIAIIAKIIGVYGDNIPVLISVDLRHNKAEAQNGNAERATNREIVLSLGLLSFMEESLSKK